MSDGLALLAKVFGGRRDSGWLTKYPLWQYPHYWWWLFRQAVHERHDWQVECYLYDDGKGRTWLQGNEPKQWVARGAIERCSCGKARKVWPA